MQRICQPTNHNRAISKISKYDSKTIEFQTAFAIINVLQIEFRAAFRGGLETDKLNSKKKGDLFFLNRLSNVAIVANREVCDK